MQQVLASAIRSSRWSSVAAQTNGDTNDERAEARSRPRPHLTSSAADERYGNGIISSDRLPGNACGVQLKS